MARTRIKKGLLEFSTNPETSKLLKKYVMEVVYTVSNKVSLGYNIISKKHDKDENK